MGEGGGEPKVIEMRTIVPRTSMSRENSQELGPGGV